jgi:ankyrin repeat protein
MLAVMQGNYDLVKYLVEAHKAEINCVENEGFTPFMVN